MQGNKGWMSFRSVVSIAGFCLLWEVVSRSGVVNPALFPAPSKAAWALWEMARKGDLWRDLYASYGRLVVGLALGCFVGVVSGLCTGRIRSISEFVGPLIEMFRPLPPVAIIPLIIVWFGIGEEAKIFSIAFAVFFPVWLNTHIGAQRVPQNLLWCASTLTDSRFKVFVRVIFPAALPFTVAGVRSAISLSFVMVFVSELAGASEGLGYRIATAQLTYRIDEMIAALAVLGASGALADFLFSRIVLWRFPWLQLSKAN